MKRGALVGLALLIIGLVSLGVWQIHRRAWKLALIAHVEQQLAATPVPAPGPADWPGVGPGDAYRRVTVHGRLDIQRATLVQAATDLGAGYWVMTPLRTDRGFIVLVNRGFVPPERKADALAPPASMTITGLLRISEPGGAFLRSNDPAGDRWYSRDVPAIAAKRALGPVAPYFIDADAASSPAWPRGGLTVIAFPNNHLAYAITWFGMAALLAGMGLRMAFHPHRD